MAIDKVFDGAVDGIADNLFNSVSNSVSEIKAMQQRKAAENVQLVVQALKKIDADIREKYDGVTATIEQRVANIKDGRDGIDGKHGRDGINGKDGRDGKDGRNGRDGATGPRGFDGPKGADGKDGQDGEDGVSITDAHIDFDGSLIISLSTGRVINVGEVVAADIAEKIKVITNGGGTSQTVLDTLTSLQNQIDAIISGLSYQGTWNASTNTPTLTSSVGTSNYYYIVSVSGSTNLNGITDWQVGDWAIFNGSVWQKIDQSNLVTSVAGRTGAVTLTTADIGGLGTIATQAANNVSITGGSITGITDLAVADGGTGASTASGARTNLGLGTMATQNASSVAITGGTINFTSIGVTTPDIGKFSGLTVVSTMTLTDQTALSALALDAGKNVISVTNTGSGNNVLANSPTLVTPILGTPASGNFSTGSFTWPTFNQNTTGVASNVTGTVAISNGGTGQTTANAAFNALAPSQTGNSGKYLTTDGSNTSWATNPLGTVTSVAATVPSFLSISGSPITTSGTLAIGLSGTALPTTSGGTGLTSFTSGGVAYASSSSALTTGSALTFDGTGAVSIGSGGTGSVTAKITLSGSNANNYGAQIVGQRNGSSTWILGDTSSILGGATTGLTNYVYGDTPFIWYNGGTSAEQMRLTSTGLGIGTSSPAYKLDVLGTSRIYQSGNTAASLMFNANQGSIGTGYAFTLAQTNSAGNYNFTIAEGATTYLTLTNSISGAGGNLGLGVTPSAWDTSVYKAIQLANGVALASYQSAGAPIAWFGANAYYNGGNKYVGSGAATQYIQNQGAHQWYIAPSGTAGNAITFTQAMTLDASGDLGIGTTSPDSKLHVSANGRIARLAATTGTSSAYLAFSNTGGNYFIGTDNSAGTGLFVTGGAAYGFSIVSESANPIVFGTNNTERARIDSSGNLLVGTTSSVGGNGITAGTTSSGKNITLVSSSYANNGVVNCHGTDGNLKLQLGATSSTAAYVYAHTGCNLDFYSNGSVSARLDTSGNLGIGTTSPAYKLDVNGSARINNLLWFTPSSGGMALGADGTNFNIYNGAGTETRLTLNNSGNLGLGVTPSAWGSTYKALQVTSSLALMGDGAASIYGNNAYDNSGWKYTNSAYAGLYVQNNGGVGAHAWYTAPSGTAGNAITFTQAMTLDASGRLLLGATSAPSSSFFGGGNAVTSFITTTQGTTNSYNNVLIDSGSNGGSSVAFTRSLGTVGAVVGYNYASGSGDGLNIYSVDALPLILGTNNAERARILSNGVLLVGTSSAYNSDSTTQISGNPPSNQVLSARHSGASPNGLYILYSGASPNNTGNYFGLFVDSSTTRFELRSNGGIANYQANDANLSDRREKTNFAPAGSYLEKICAIPVQTFNYIDQNMEEDGGLTLGVVAQDVQAVAPELVMESNWAKKDEAPKMRLSIYQTDLQYALMKALQELKAEFDAYKASHP